MSRERETARHRWVSPVLLAGAACAAVLLSDISTARAIPAFARAYNVPCSSCHGPTITRRGEFGDVFRKAGYHWPMMAEDRSNQLEAVELKGTAAAQALLPKSFPLAVRATLSAAYLTDRDVESELTLGNPNLLVLLGAAFGDYASVFGTWTGTGPPQELYAHFARIFNRPELNVRVGLFEQTTTMFKENERLIAGFVHGSRAMNGHIVSEPRLGVEGSGVIQPLGGRTFWAAGAVQNGGTGSHWDGYYHLEQKIGGISLLGEEHEIDIFAEPSFWEGVHATVSHFGYFGTVQDLEGTETFQIRRFGLEGKLDVHRFSLWSGVMLGLDDDLMFDRSITNLTWFVEASYPVLSWLVPVYAYQYHDSSDLQRQQQQHDVGFLALIVENVRARLKFSFSADDVRNDSVEAELLVAF